MVPPSKNGTCAILCQSVGTAKSAGIPTIYKQTTNVPLFFIYVFIFVVFVLCVMGMERHSKKGGEK
jgi:hypothetical protein